tara:strand:- start:4653 stop:4775 length:123 start_codon:yes stop_codon:yes gene_type:complete
MADDPDTPGEWFQFAVAQDPGDGLIGDVALHIYEDNPTEA